ncbi:putative organ specific protein [Medicago truncatula]|uniref:DUF2775 family protein n=1 Tax=Medicago truncatula TaxID=3880 RepID=G7KEH3_MEDTR|nr:uncharacterized protein LOC11442320 [Medicago truncatula]AET00794.1 DUF2775 family protein [Medicago truncatula]RHN58021.1 putative organ specific protein [Medicago truncatula]
MKSIQALFLVFSLLLVANLSYARKDLGDYWKNKMNEQPMPEAIKNLIQVPKALDEGKEDHSFTTDFDVNPNIILYHTHVHQDEKPFQHAARKMEPLLPKRG